MALPGVESIITAEDIPGENGFPGYSHDEPILTPLGETLKMKGAPFALVIANTPDNAQKAMQAVQVE